MIAGQNKEIAEEVMQKREIDQTGDQEEQKKLIKGKSGIIMNYSTGKIHELLNGLVQ